MEKFKFISKKNLLKLPKEAGVYLFENSKSLFYIGKAADIKDRVKNHFQQPTYRDNLFINKVSKIGYIKTNSEIEALILEANLIKKYQPRFNVVWRDDKNYFYVAMTQEPFPQIFTTHQPKLKINYAGPFVDGKALKETLKILRKVFPYRSCRFLPKKSCLWYHLDRCPAPCILNSKIMEVSKIREKLEKEAKKNAKSVLDIMSGGKIKVIAKLKREMKTESKCRNFERAGKIRDQIFSLERVLTNARIFGNQIVNPVETWLKTEEILRKIINTKKEISRIEAYDISNIQGKEATGSMVTFINGKPDKNFYRRFKIKISGKPNDVAMIKEVLVRRFKHREWPYPRLILIDGGIAQLNAAANLKSEILNLKSICIISLAKRKNELFVEKQKKSILLKNLPREIFNLILQLRDEAHRFAISYHKKLREVDLFKKT